MSITAKWGIESYKQEYQSGDDSNSQNEKFVFNDDYELNDFIDDYVNKNEYNIDEISAFNESFDYYNDNSTKYSRDSKGYIHEVSRGANTTLNGITFVEYSGFKATNSIYLSRNPNRINFIKTTNHELTHAFLNTKGYRNLMDEKTYKKFTESSAYMSGQGYIPNKYNQGIFPIIRPPHLIPIPTW